MQIAQVMAGLYAWRCRHVAPRHGKKKKAEEMAKQRQISFEGVAETNKYQRRCWRAISSILVGKFVVMLQKQVRTRRCFTVLLSYQTGLG